MEVEKAKAHWAGEVWAGAGLALPRQLIYACGGTPLLPLLFIWDTNVQKWQLESHIKHSAGWFPPSSKINGHLWTSYVMALSCPEMPPCEHL